MQSVSPVHQPPAPLNSSSDQANAGSCCPICLESYDAYLPKLPTATTECGHRAHSGCLEQWKINSTRSTCPVCRTTLTGAAIEDLAPLPPTEVDDGQPLSSDRLRASLLRAAQTCSTDQVDTLLALYSPLDNDALVVCAEVVSKLMCKASIRVSIMSWHEYNQLRNFIKVLVKHGAVSRSWEEEDVARLFRAWKAYERDDVVQNAPTNSRVHISSCFLQKALQKAALSKDFHKTVRLLDQVGSDVLLQKIAIEVVDGLLQERLNSRGRYDWEDYRTFTTYVDLFLCRRLCDQRAQIKAMQLYVLMSDYRRAALAKEEFGVGLISGDTLRLSLNKAALEMDLEEVKSLLDIALPDASAQKIASSVLQNVLLRVRSYLHQLTSMDRAKLGWLVDAFFQHGALDQAQADSALDVFILCEDYPRAVRLKSMYGAEPRPMIWKVAMHKATCNKDYLLAAMLLDLATSQILQDVASPILATQLQNMLSQAQEIGLGPRELKKLWRFVNTFFKAGVVNANLIRLTANIYGQVNDQNCVDCLRSMYGEYFNGAEAPGLQQEQASSLTLHMDALNLTTEGNNQNSGLESRDESGAPITRQPDSPVPNDCLKLD